MNLAGIGILLPMSHKGEIPILRESQRRNGAAEIALVYSISLQFGKQ